MKKRVDITLVDGNRCPQICPADWNKCFQSLFGKKA
jgi:hypothetical protein